MAFSNIEHYVVDADGYLALAEGAPKDAMRAVSSVKRKMTVKEFGKSTITEYEVEFKLWDKPGTLKLAGRHVGLFPDRLELSGKNGQPLMPRSRRSRTRS